MYDSVVLQNYLFITIKNDLVFGSNAGLESFIELRLTSDIKGVVLNLTQTKYIDSSGISHIIRLKKMIDSCMKNFFIVVDNPRIEKVLGISRIDNFIHIFKNNQDVFEFHSSGEERSINDLFEYKIGIPGEYKYIEIVEGFLEKILDKHYDYEDNDKYDIDMYLEEAISNSIEHGYQESGSKGKICVMAVCRRTELVIFVDDYGKGFDASKIMDRVEESITRDSLRGRGIMILKGISDEIHIDSVENKFSSIIIVKKLNMKE